MSGNTTKFHKPARLLGVRHFQVFMLFFAMVLLFGINVSISIVIVAMTDTTQENSFNWSHQSQSVILSAFKWGYILLKIPGGEVAARYGGSYVMIPSVAINAIASLLLPLSRAVQGLAQGAVYPAIHNLMSKWALLEEKSRLTTIVYAGGHLGLALQLMVAGFIINYWNWKAIFYINGVLGLIWTVLYMIFGSSSPKDSKIISAEEKLYIEYSLGQVGETKKVPTPWFALLTSVPFWALVVVNSGSSWGYWILLTESNTYISKILGADIVANGMISALPYLACYIASFPFGYIADYTLKKKWISVSASRKLSNSIGLYSPAICLIGLSYSYNNVALAVTLLTLGSFLNGGHFTGYLMSFLDMAPNHAGTTLAISMSIANIISLGAPLSAGFIIKDETLPSEWRKVFFLAAAMYSAGNTVYVIFGTSKKQKWNNPPQENEVQDIEDPKGVVAV